MRSVPFALVASATLLSAQALAQHAGHAEHQTPSVDHREHVETHAPAAPPLPAVTEALRTAAFPDLADMRMRDMMLEDPLNRLVLFDRLEQHDAPGDPLAWDLDTWIGRTLTRIWVRSEGERRDGHTERNELTVAWGKGIARWWDITAGARRDFAPGDTRDWAAFGIRGLAPYRFDVAATAFVGEAGHTAFRLESSYEILVTNRLILTPTLELDWHGKTDEAHAIGAGLGSAELGMRLRYEFRREIAPYVGLTRERRFGRTADRAGAEEDTLLVMGLRLWF